MNVMLSALPYTGHTDVQSLDHQHLCRQRAPLLKDVDSGVTMS